MKSVLFVLAALASVALANTAPTVVIQSATMRPGTTLMDVVYRVNDPDDATVKTRALAFVDGVRSFANVIKPVSFVEGTAAKLGDAIPANVDHTLTWDVAADWNIDLGQVTFEVLAMDGRGLLPIDWITIPAAGGKPAITISQNAPNETQIMDGLFWRYASDDNGLLLTNGLLKGNSDSGIFVDLVLANAGIPHIYGGAYLMKGMNLDPATVLEESFVTEDARADVTPSRHWHVINRSYAGVMKLFPGIQSATIDFDPRLVVDAYYDGAFGFLLLDNGNVLRWGQHWIDVPSNIPDELVEIADIGIGWSYGIALKKDGSAFRWGSEFGYDAYSEVIQNLGSDFKKLATTDEAYLLLRNNGTLLLGGTPIGRYYLDMPHANISQIAGAGRHFIALIEGVVYGWGPDYDAEWETGPFSRISAGPIPGLSGATAIATGLNHVLALKADGTVMAWGNTPGTSVPEGLSGVTAIEASSNGGYAWKNDGSVVVWGDAYLPSGLTNVKIIKTGGQIRVLGKKL